MLKKLTKEHKIAIAVSFVLGVMYYPLFLLTTILVYFNKVKFAKYSCFFAVLVLLFIENKVILLQMFNGSMFLGYASLLITSGLAYFTVNKVNKEKQEIYEEISKTEKNMFKTLQEHMFKKSEGGDVVNNNLSSKYSVLKVFQMLVGGVTIVQVILSVSLMIDIGRQFKGVTAISMISLLLLQIFMSICLILMVNFLFDLNNSKSDK